MTKRDYEAIAAIVLRHHRLDGKLNNGLIMELGNYFASRNVRFDMAKWKLACRCRI